MVILFAVPVGGGGGGVGGGVGGGGGGRTGGGPQPTPTFWGFLHELRGVGGLFLQLAAYPPTPPPPRFGGGKEGKREVFTCFSHPTRRQGWRTLNPKP